MNQQDFEAIREQVNKEFQERETRWEKERQELKAFCQTLPQGNYQELWAQIEAQFPRLELGLPQIKHWQRPCGCILPFLGTFSVIRFYPQEGTPDHLLALAQLLAWGRSEIRRGTREQVPQMLQELGLGDDGWEV